MRAYLWQISNRFHFFFFEVVVIDAGSRYFVDLLSRLVWWLTITLQTFLCMTSYVIKTMKKYENSQSTEAFQFPPRKFSIQTWLSLCPQYLCLFHFVFECSPSMNNPWKMLVLRNRLLCWVISTSDQCFVSFQPTRCLPHTQIRKILFDGVRISIANCKPCSNRA